MFGWFESLLKVDKHYVACKCFLLFTIIIFLKDRHAVVGKHESVRVSIHAMN